MKRRDSLIINILIVIFELIGFFVTYKINNSILIEFYTEESNLLLLVTCLIYVFYLIRKKRCPKWLSILKYISTTCVTITLLVVIFVLIPMAHFDFINLLFKNTMLYHHTICPLLGITSFLFFDDLGKFNKDDSKYGISLTIVYAIVMIIMNIIGKIEGPYPFLMVMKQPIFVSIFWVFVILGLAYLIAKYLLKLYSYFRS